MLKLDAEAMKWFARLAASHVRLKATKAEIKKLRCYKREVLELRKRNDLLRDAINSLVKEIYFLRDNRQFVDKGEPPPEDADAVTQAE